MPMVFNLFLGAVNLSFTYFLGLCPLSLCISCCESVYISFVASVTVFRKALERETMDRTYQVTVEEEE